MPDLVLLIGDRRIDARISPPGHQAPASPAAARPAEGEWTVRVAGAETRLRLQQLDATTWRIVDEHGAARIARSIEQGGTRWLHLDGETLAVRVEEAGRAAQARTAPRVRGGRRFASLEAPMPGTVTQVAVREGDRVSAGQPIAVVEAMKMEHVIRAPRAGRVAALRVRPGDQVEAGAVVADVEAVPEASA
jgi:biotin carboxyl carrier protein